MKYVPTYYTFIRCVTKQLCLFLALKTLRFCPRLRSNLNAILYMTGTEQLVPLQELVLSKVSRDMTLVLQVRLAFCLVIWLSNRKIIKYKNSNQFLFSNFTESPIDCIQRGIVQRSPGCEIRHQLTKLL